MGRFNLKQASLLDASGELGQPARQQLAIRIIDDPAARRQHAAAQKDLAVLQILPVPEPSAAERQAIPAMIKQTVHQALREKEAAEAKAPTPIPGRRGHRWAQWAFGSLALAACAAIVASLAMVDHSQNALRQAQVARINAAIDRATSTPDHSLLALDATSRDQQTPTAPTLSFLPERPESLHESLSDFEGPMVIPDPASPPG